MSLQLFLCIPQATMIYNVKLKLHYVSLHRGKFAVVKECRHKQKDSWYAAKVIRKRRKGVDCRSEILQEVSMLRITLSHPHFVDIIEVYETTSEMIIITEL